VEFSVGGEGVHDQVVSSVLFSPTALIKKFTEKDGEKIAACLKVF
jgi:hypothetical protein